MSPLKEPPTKVEEEHTGSIIGHPYLIYVIGTGVLFLLLVVLGWLALRNGWIPNRGIG